MDEDHILNNQGNQCLYRTRAQTHECSGKQVLLQARAKGSKQATSPSTSCSEQEHWSTADPDGCGNEEVARNTVRQKGHRGQEGDFIEGSWLDARWHDGHGIDVETAAATLGLEVDVVEDARVDPRVLEDEDGEETTDDDLC